MTRISVFVLGLTLFLAQVWGQPAPPPGEPPVADRAERTGSQAASAGPTADEGRAPTRDAEDAPAASPAAADGTDEAAAAAVAMARKKKPLPPVADEAQGTCATPRQAWLQLLYWLQKGANRWQPARAAECFDAAHLEPGEAARRAGMLLEILDTKSAYIQVDQIPTDPDYTENGLGQYVDPIARRRVGADITVIKKGDRWLFSADTLEQVPELYPALAARLQELLPAWMNTRVLAIEAWKYFAIILLVLLSLVVKRVTLYIVSRYVARLVKRTGLTYLERTVDYASRPFAGLVMAGVLFLGVPALVFPIRVTQILMIAIEALAAFSIVWLGYRLIDVLRDFLEVKAERTDSKLDDQLVPMVSKTLKVFVSVVGGLFILQNLDVNVGSLIAGLGLGGLAFALAAKDTIANFFGSLMIFIDKPFQIGDWVVMAGTEGIVEEVGFRTSRVRTFYNSLVTVPNALVTNATVDNYGKRQYRRYSTTLGLAYDTPPDKVEAFCEGVRAIIAANDMMRKDYYVVEFKDFGASSLNVMVYCFTTATSYNDEMRTRTRLNLEILRLAEQLGVSFAFPTQTLHIESMARAGESNPSHSGPTEEAALAAIINGFGPGGPHARPDGVRLTEGWDCGTEAVMQTKRKGGDG